MRGGSAAGLGLGHFRDTPPSLYFPTQTRNGFGGRDVCQGQVLLPENYICSSRALAAMPWKAFHRLFYTLAQGSWFQFVFNLNSFITFWKVDSHKSWLQTFLERSYQITGSAHTHHNHSWNLIGLNPIERQTSLHSPTTHRSGLTFYKLEIANPFNR